MTQKQLKELIKIRRDETRMWQDAEEETKRKIKLQHYGITLNRKHKLFKREQTVLKKPKSITYAKMSEISESPEYDGVYALTAAIVDDAITEWYYCGCVKFFETEFFKLTGLDAEYLKRKAVQHPDWLVNKKSYDRFINPNAPVNNRKLRIKYGGK